MRDDLVDIVIPVYNAANDLRRCVESLKRCTNTAHRVILIDDASPDAAVGELFRELERDLPEHWQLLRNERNLGFIGTTNRGMSLSENDVVLLNSDTVVTERWLEKLRRCAESDPRIGTITPFSNNAEICSFPRFCEDNAWSDRDDPELLNSAMEAAAVPEYPNLPTGVGFCFYIKRALIKRIGLFDPVFGLGYGEENDFCLRAEKAGFRNVLCEDTLVLHLGNRSFDAKKKALAARNMEILLEHHPDYSERVMKFIRSDPLRPYRDAVQSQWEVRRNATHRPGILHIQHGKGGGTESHIRALIEATRGNFRHYLMTTLGETWEIEDHNGATVVHYHLRHQQDELWRDFLAGICDSFGIHLCHVHHLSGCREGLLAALQDLPVPYGVTIHDFYLACPTITLLDSRDNFCGAQTDARICRACLNEQAHLRGVPIESWRGEHARFLAAAAFVLAPSQSAADTLARYFALHDVAVIAHGMSAGAEPAKTGMRTVLLLPHDGVPVAGVLGAIGPVKGARRLERLVARTRERGLSLRWVLVGYLDRQYQAYQDGDAAFTIHGPYRREDVPALFDHYGIDLVVFPSAGPETFSFTLSEAWAAGRPALVPPIGALGERMEKHQAGWIMEDWTDDDRILDQLLELMSAANATALARAGDRARAAANGGLAEMAALTAGIYRLHLRQNSAKAMAALPAARLLEALRIAHGKSVARYETSRRFVDRALLRIAHLGLRFRYTILGKVMYRVVPQSLQRNLKQRLLA